jgi:RNA polymerase sigma-70 factor (ECF subfamily)
MEELARPKTTVRAVSERDLAARIDSARRAWPALRVKDLAFVRALARAARVTEEGVVDLAAIATHDLYLATACVHGDPAAVKSLVGEHFPALRRTLLRRRLPSHVTDDVLANLRDRLLFSRGGDPPLLTRYSGHGPLSSWLARTAWRDAIKAVERARRSTPLDEGTSPIAAIVGEDPELLLLRRTYASELRDAVTTALESLGPTERKLLRQVVAEESSADIARRERVHRVTVNRRLARIREQVLDAVKARLAARLNLPLADVGALANVIGPDLEVSVNRLLAKPPKKADFVAPSARRARRPSRPPRPE